MSDAVLDPATLSPFLPSRGAFPLTNTRHNAGFFEALAKAYRNRVDATSSASRMWGTNVTGVPRQAAGFARSSADTLALAPTGVTPIGADRPPGSVSELIAAAARQESVPTALLSAVVKVESGFRPSAVSSVGAKGLTQLMDGTARTLGVTDSFDPWQNLVGGARFLRGLLSRYNGNVELAAAAYNAGPGAVDRYGGTVPPYAETQSYVRQVLTAYHNNLAAEVPGGSR